MALAEEKVDEKWCGQTPLMCKAKTSFHKVELSAKQTFNFHYLDLLGSISTWLFFSQPPEADSDSSILS